MLPRMSAVCSRTRRSWLDKLRPARRPEAKPSTQAFLQKLREEYDWKRYRGDFKNPRRKSRSLLPQLRREELEARRSYEIPEIQAGDAIEMTLLYELDEEKRQACRGMVLAKVNKGVDSNVLLYCVVANTPHIRRIPLYSPLVLDCKIIQKAFLHKGQKRVRRAKLYYLLDQKKPIRAP